MAGLLGESVLELSTEAGKFVDGITAAKKKASELDTRLESTTKLAAGVGVALAAAGASIVGTFTAMTKMTADYGDALAKSSERTGIGVEQLAKLKFAAEQSGSSFEGLSTGLKFLAKNMQAATSGGKEQAAAFRALGINVADSTGKLRSADEVMLDVADRFESMEDGADKTAIAMQVFGRSGADLIPTLNEGSAGLTAMGDTASRLGLVLSTEATKASEDFNDRLDDLQKATEGIGITIGMVFIPIITDLATKATNVVVAIREWVSAHPGLTKAIGVLGLALTGAGGLLLGLAGVLAILPTLGVAFGILTGPVGLTVMAIGALAAGIIYFRKEIAGSLLFALSKAVEGFSKFIGIAARLAAAVGLDGIAGKLQSMKFSVEETAISLDEMSNAALAGVVATEAVKVSTGGATEGTKSFTLALKDNTAAADEAKKAIEELVVKNQAALAQHLEAVEEAGSKWITVMSNAYTKDLDAFIKSRQTILDITDANRAKLQEGLDQEVEKNGKWIDVMSDQYSKGLDKRIHDLDETLKAQKKAEEDAFNSVKDTAKKTFTAIFADGKFQFKALADTVKGIFGTLATEILSTMTAKLLTPLTTKITGALSGLLGKIPGLGGGGGLGGLLGGAGAAGGGAAAAGGIGGGAAAGGGAAGGGLGGLGALMTNPWTIGIGGAIAAGLVLSKKIGQGRKQADKFVGEFQNPFGDALGTIVDSFNIAADAGQITKDEATNAREQVALLWQEFQTNAAEFAKQGDNQAKVVRQAFETLEPLMENVLGDMDVRIAGIAPPAEEAAVATEKLSKNLGIMTTHMGPLVDMIGRLNADYVAPLSGAMADAAASAEMLTHRISDNDAQMRNIIHDNGPAGDKGPLSDYWKNLLNPSAPLTGQGGVGIEMQSGKFVDASTGTPLPQAALDQLNLKNAGTFATGSSYIPRDTFAQLHQGEAVLTAGQNAARQGMGGEVVELLREIAIGLRAGMRVMIDGREVASAVDESARFGGSLLRATGVR